MATIEALTRGADWYAQGDRVAQAYLPTADYENFHNHISKMMEDIGLGAQMAFAETTRALPAGIGSNLVVANEVEVQSVPNNAQNRSNELG